jgi:hypothetical protein
LKKQISILILVCASLISEAQTNFVKNPSFEDFSSCPFEYNQLSFCKFWTNAIDTIGTPIYASEYYNQCATTNPRAGIPKTDNFYQFPHSGKGVAGVSLFFDETIMPNYREYIQGHLQKKLIAGQTYCISFYVNLMESSGYAHNKIGAYLDDGSINKLSLAPSIPITTVIPQVFSSAVIEDTLGWTKIEGSFIAIGNESYITIGNFSSKSAITYKVTNYWLLHTNYSYYLIDDVSVIPIDLPADAGKDTWVEVGKQVQIGRVGDTTAQGLDCKWYKKGTLIDSGAIITVNANSSINAIDTYVVVQNICGVIKRDSVNVKTTGLGISEMSFENAFSIYPNPSNGNFTITCSAIPNASVLAKVYDLLGRVVHQEQLNFSNKEATLKLNIPTGSYILELKDEAGNVQRERIVIN